MSNKLIKKTKENKKQRREMIITITLGVSLVLSVLLLVAATHQKQEPIINPGAISFTYNPETGAVEAEELGEEFEWKGYWEGNETTQNNIQLMEEIGEEKFWEVFGHE